MKAKGYRTIAGLDKLTPEEVKQRNLDTYGKRIKTFRTRAGLTAGQLADSLEISQSSVRNWECGLTRPDPEFLYRMFSILNVEPNEFFEIGGIGTLLTTEERELLDNYRALDEAGKEDVEIFTRAMREKVRERMLKAALRRMCPLKDLGRFASAGDGADWEDHPDRQEVLLFHSPAVAGADEIITVTGASMEPQFFHHDRVLVQYCAELRNGDIGIFYVPGHGGVIKQKSYDRLHSINPDYDDIFPYEEGAQVVGRVLGRITREMIPSREEQLLYREAVDAFKETQMNPRTSPAG